MLRVGLTGGLGSGKSTVGKIFAALGAAVIDADEVGRRLMQPGQMVFDAIVEKFGRRIVRENGTLDRRTLAAIAFDEGRIEELNRIVHPAVIAAQEAWLHEVFAAKPNAVAIIESALIFEASRSGSVAGWRDRFDKIILVTAPDEVKIQRFVARTLTQTGGDAESLAADARKRLAAQIPDLEKLAYCDWVIENTGDLTALRALVEEIYVELSAAAAHTPVPIK